jgi:trehalose synthase
MARRIDIGRTTSLEEYEAVAHLAPAVLELRREAASLRPKLDGRTVWMVNSTSQGGGVAEMLPALIGLLRDLGVRAEWVVLESEDPAFFAFTKRLHNLIHGEGEMVATRADRERFEAVNRENAAQLATWMRPEDLLVVHDPQPAPLARFLGPEAYAAAIWRCHIGLDEETPETRFAWQFLEPYTSAYEQSIFSAPEYIPEYLRTRSSIIHRPALAEEPRSHAAQARGRLRQRSAGATRSRPHAAVPGCGPAAVCRRHVPSSVCG